MSTTIRLRPIDCCSTVTEPEPLTPAGKDRMLAMFKALADGTRLEVFRLIAAQSEPLCACDIVDRFDVSQPTIAHHLKVLREAGLITVSRRGIWAYYAVDPQGAEALQSISASFIPTTERETAIA